MPGVKVVTFDALHTLIAPRLPIHVQYARAFEPYLGALSEDRVKTGFKQALREMQSLSPAYRQYKDRPGDADWWWKEVIRRTALHAGADDKSLNASLQYIHPSLMKIFSSKEGYKLFDDTIPTLNALREIGIKLAIVSNSDKRMTKVLEDLALLPYFSSVALSEEIGVGKPKAAIFKAAVEKAHPGVSIRECVHVGDDLQEDAEASVKAGMMAGLWLTRDEREVDCSSPTGILSIQNLQEAAVWVVQRNQEMSAILH